MRVNESVEPMHWERQVTGEVWRAGSHPRPFELSSCKLTYGPSSPGQQVIALAIIDITTSMCDRNWVKHPLIGSYPADLFCKKTLELALSL